MTGLANLLPYVGLVALGVAVGAFGTLIGAGGGFILVPVLLLLYPHQSPAQLTAVSLAVVLANAAAGSLSYRRLRRTDYRSGIWLAIATLPGSVIGAVVVGAIPKGAFELVIGMSLVLVGAFLLVQPHGRLHLLTRAPFSVERTVVDSEGHSYRYRFNQGLAMLFSIGVGFLSGILGIGGGIIHVPLLATFFEFPEHVATATSHFVLMFTSGAGAGTHVLEGDYAGTLALTASLAAGVLVGAPFGAAISRRFSGQSLIRLLAVALGVVGVRLMVAI